MFQLCRSVKQVLLPLYRLCVRMLWSQEGWNRHVNRLNESDSPKILDSGYFQQSLSAPLGGSLALPLQVHYCDGYIKVNSSSGHLVV